MYMYKYRTFYTQSPIDLNKNNGGGGIHDISDSVEDSSAPIIVYIYLFIYTYISKLIHKCSYISMHI
jgi:hypothetical protein